MVGTEWIYNVDHHVMLGFTTQALNFYHGISTLRIKCDKVIVQYSHIYIAYLIWHQFVFVHWPLCACE